jgi:tetratricopeptide (TPR) repeat protein
MPTVEISRVATGALLALAVLVAFWPILDNDFVSYDDNTYVTDNPHVKQGLTRETIAWTFTATQAANWHPLTWISHILDWEMYGGEPRGHHLTSLLFHVLNTLLLFAVLRRMTGAVGRSAFVAALFGVHPLHVESVAWIAERKDVLSTTLWLLAIWAYLHYVRKPSARRLVLVAAALALGLTAKPMLVTLPFTLLLLDFWPLARWPKPGDRNRRRLLWALVREKIPLFALVAASSLITFAVQRQGLAMSSLDDIPLAQRLGNAAASYAVYLQKTFWPVDLAVYYPHPVQSLSPVAVAISIAILVALTAAAVALRRERRYLLVGWLWYLGTLVPVVGVVQVGGQALADRYTYVPLIGIFVILAWGIPDLLRTTSRVAPADPRWLALPAVLVVALLAGVTRNQAGYWRDSATLFTHALQVTENNYIAHVHLGIARAAEGRFEESLRHYERALAIRPGDARARYNLGVLLASQGRYEEAVEHYAAALRARPAHARTHNNMGTALLSMGRVGEAETHFAEAIRLDPGYGGAVSNLAAALYAQGRYREAWAEVARARQLGFSPPQGLIERLSRAMPDPGPER